MHAQLHIAPLLSRSVMQADRLLHVLHGGAQGAAALPWVRLLLLSPRRGELEASELCTHGEPFPAAHSPENVPHLSCFILFMTGGEQQEEG